MNNAWRSILLSSKEFFNSAYNLAQDTSASVDKPISKTA